MYVPFTFSVNFFSSLISISFVDNNTSESDSFNAWASISAFCFRTICCTNESSSLIECSWMAASSGIWFSESESFLICSFCCWLIRRFSSTCSWIARYGKIHSLTTSQAYLWTRVPHADLIIALFLNCTLQRNSLVNNVTSVSMNTRSARRPD